MTETNKVTCANCGTEGDRDNSDILKSKLTSMLPSGWGTLVITRNEGIATNSVVCKTCLMDVRVALSIRRAQSQFNSPENSEETTVDPDLGHSKESQEAEAKQAEPDYEEIKAAYLEHEKEIDEIKEAEAQDSPPVQAESTALQDSSPVSADALEETVVPQREAQEEGTLPTKPQQLSNRAKQRARAAVNKVEQKAGDN